MTRRLTIEWPDPAPFRDRDGMPIRILAVSDILEPTLTDARNRIAIAPVDFIVGCGDLDQDDLAFITFRQQSVIRRKGDASRTPGRARKA